MLTHLAQRHTRHRTCLLRELAGDTCINGVVTAVMWARRHFIDDQRTIGEHEEFYAQHADISKLLNHSQRCRLRFFGGGLGDIWPGHGRRKQNPVSMYVFCNRINNCFAVGTTRCQYGNFICQWQHLFQHASNAIHAGIGVMQFSARFNPNLAFAVIAHPYCFQYARQ